MDIRGIILSIFTLILIMTQNVFADGSVGQLMIADVVTRAEIEKNIEQEQTGMFSGSDTYRKAAELYKHIITEEEGTLWECPVGSYGEATKVVQCLGYEILNGRCERCLDMLETLQVDEEHLYDYTNLRGRILLCLNRFDESLPYLLQYRQ